MHEQYFVRDANGHCGTVAAASPEDAVRVVRGRIQDDGRHLSATLDPHCEAARFRDVVAMLGAYARLEGGSDRDVESWVLAGWDADTDAEGWLDAWREGAD